MRCSDIKIIKKDGTREKCNVEKIKVAVNKSAGRILYDFNRHNPYFLLQGGCKAC